MKILGISCFYHDSAAALVVDGLLKAAAGEERFTRLKHDPELPVNAVEFCLKRAGIEINDLDYIVFYDKPVTKFERIITGYMSTPVLSYKSFVLAAPVWLRRKLWVGHVIDKELGFKKEILHLTHHMSHAAGAFFCSPFEEAAILTVDGVGEWATASYGIGRNNRIELLKEMHYPHSVGLLYSAFTYYLGFQVNSAEYKVMGLAPYGKPDFQDLIEGKIVRICDDGSIFLNLDHFEFHYAQTMTGKKFDKLFGRPRRAPESPIEPFHENVAASIQAVLEKIVLKMATYVQETTKQKKLCLSGGVALNATANGKLVKSGLFDDIYSQPAAGDAGGAVGAALYAHHTLTKETKRHQPFFGIGPQYLDEEIKTFLESNSIPYRDEPLESQLELLAQRITDGHVAGIFQGAMEFGPRALGFRSIVADPRDNKMKEKINAAVKYREPFRPFAPAVLKEKTSKYFDCPNEAPYMIVNYTVHESKRNIIPAVTHVDNSSRIQTVAKEDNPVFYRLIEEFERLTGVPVLLNTSFNLRGYPIVNTPREAVETFCTGGIDFLLLNRYLLTKTDIAPDILSRFLLNKKFD
jgi:carbamoyltransferase